MRSIYIHLWRTNKAAVASALDAAFPTQRTPWIRFVDEDPCLYIEFCDDGPIVEENWNARFASYGGPPDVSVIADGRRFGC